MPKLRVLSAREVIDILESQGFVRARQRGSHVAMQKVGADGSTTTAIVPNHKQIKLPTLASIIRQSQLPRELFESQ